MHSKVLFSLGAAALLPLTAQAASGSGATTRYWDCCKPSCSWSGKANVSQPVWSCDSSGNHISDPSTVSGCQSGGTAYACPDQTPWALNSLVSYGYAATSISGGTEASWCCACYLLTFTSGKALGKQMVVQSINTGSDLGSNQFDLAIPGGGVGIFDGCTSEFGGIAGAQYGGIANRSQCATMPTALQAGCYWRFDWFLDSDNPTMTFEQVSCPTDITARTGCVRNDDSSFPSFTMPANPTWTSPTPTATAQAYGQCDTIEWSVASACPVGYYCSEQSEYYWQCVPGTVSSSSTSSSSKVTTTSTTSSTHTTSSSTHSSSSSSTVHSTTSTSSSTSTSKATTTSSSSASGATQSEWGQCGGSGYTGPTKCGGTFTCSTQNPYYAQCV